MIFSADILPRRGFLLRGCFGRCYRHFAPNGATFFGPTHAVIASAAKQSVTLFTTFSNVQNVLRSVTDCFAALAMTAFVRRLALGVFLVLGSFSSVFSQKQKNFAEKSIEGLHERHLSFGIGLNWETRRDDLFSPLRYSGIGVNLQNSFERITEKWFRQFALYGSANMMKSRVKNGYNYEGYAFRYGLSLNWMRRVLKNENRFRWYVGGGFSSLGSWSILPANVNNYVSFDVPTGLFASTYLRKDLRFWRRNWIVGTQISMPLLTYNARPQYIGIWDETAFLNDFQVVTLNKLFQIDWRWLFEIPLSNNNRLRFTYRWDFLNDRQEGKLQAGSQIGTFEFLTNLPYRSKIKN